MRNEIIIPVLKEEDTVAANLRRDKYSQKRDVQAKEFNDAIITRLAAEAKVHVKCEKCGKEFEPEDNNIDSLICSECS